MCVLQFGRMRDLTERECVCFIVYERVCVLQLARTRDLKIHFSVWRFGGVDSVKLTREEFALGLSKIFWPPVRPLPWL